MNKYFISSKIGFIFIVVVSNSHVPRTFKRTTSRHFSVSHKIK